MKTSFAIAFAAALISISSAASAESASANAASSPCADGKCSYIDFTSGDGFTTQNLFGPNSQYSAKSDVKEVVISGSTFSSSAPGYIIFNGTQKITIENSTFSNATDSALWFRSHKGPSNTEIAADNFDSVDVTLSNVRLINNTSGSGSGAYVYGKIDMTMTDGEVRGNKVTATESAKTTDIYSGAGIEVKSGNVIFENVDFDDNVVSAAGA